ncbi:hypothetical protein Bca52824_063330 [Brassica carinata]|uniref:GRF-type domain-containing protein n=1 Tax=Brassica carinata TaxID=52824 RepID=A0A8X7QEK7_BRACI|nr:hypothetical protein Bca52824_063330 [Brassica carinata]
MDPRILYSQSAGYMGLLHSQHESVHHENSPYESFHSGSSQIPQFSSQQCEAPTPPTDTPRKTVETDSQTSTTSVGEQEIRPEGVKAAKSKRSNAKGKSVAEYTTVWEMRKEDLERKEKLSKLAILDTLLAKTEPLSKAEEVSLNMGLDYSYSQPSQSEEFGGDESDSDYNEIEALIQQDQAQLDYVNAQEFVYPPQPEVEFGFPHTCYCGSQPQIAMSHSRTDPGRTYYTCTNVDDGECHVWKWWDEAVMEEMRARDRYTPQLVEKVDSLNFLSGYETEQKLVRLENMVCELAKNKSRSSFDYFVAVMVMVLIFIGIVLIFI